LKAQFLGFHDIKKRIGDIIKDEDGKGKVELRVRT
jgi:hypothetical protein